MKVKLSQTIKFFESKSFYKKEKKKRKNSFYTDIIKITTYTKNIYIRSTKNILQKIQLKSYIKSQRIIKLQQQKKDTKNTQVTSTKTKK